MKRTQSEGGIILPDNSSDPQAYGKVLTLGKDVEKKQIKEGDIIVFHIRGGQVMLMGKCLLRVLKYDEIYGILDNKEIEENLVSMEIKSVSAEGTTQVQPVENKIIHPVS
jgi:co-chaperonin GroES (HSP10)